MNEHEDELAEYESEQELTLYKEYRDVVGLFKYLVETQRRFYLANHVEVKPVSEANGFYFEVLLEDAWVWDVYRPTRFVKSARLRSFSDVNVEELQNKDELDESSFLDSGAQND